MGNLHKMLDLPVKSDYEKERNIESYLTKIQQKQQLPRLIFMKNNFLLYNFTKSSPDG